MTFVSGTRFHLQKEALCREEKEPRQGRGAPRPPPAPISMAPALVLGGQVGPGVAKLPGWSAQGCNQPFPHPQMRCAHSIAVCVH